MAIKALLWYRASISTLNGKFELNEDVKTLERSDKLFGITGYYSIISATMVAP